jgi:hypothetical protein
MAEAALDAMAGARTAAETAGQESAGDGDIMRDQLSKRYELLAACHQKSGDRKAGAFLREFEMCADVVQAALRAYAGALAGQPPAILSQISSSLASSPIIVAFAHHSELEATFSRLGPLILSDPLVVRGEMAAFAVAMEEKQLSAVVKGGLLERLFVLLQDGEHRPEVAELMIQLGEEVLGDYKAETMPIRRLR